MDNKTSTTEEEEIRNFYDRANNLFINEGKKASEVKDILVQEGLDDKSAVLIVNNLTREILDGKKEAAKNDMIYGALWCVGGTVATLAEVGYIFWGAILFGGIQFLKGLINNMSD